MKQIEFEQLGMKNFCNHIDPVEIKFDKNKLVLITGPNGSGKTSLLQALPYTLYGICEKGRGEDVLNDKVEKNCHTWTVFSVDDDLYRVDRYVKYAKIGSTVTLMKNGTITHTGHKEVVPQIEKLLVPRKLFMNTLLFGQKVKTFFTDLTDSEQKEIFRKILKLDDYVLYQQEAGKELKHIEEQVMNINNQVAVNMGLIEDSKTEIHRLTGEKKEFYKKKKEELLLIKVAEKELKNNLNTMESMLSKYDGVEQQLEQVNNDLGAVQQRFEFLEDSLESVLEKVDSQAELKRAGLTKSADDAKLDVTHELQMRKTEITQHWLAVTTNLDSTIHDLEQSMNKIHVKVAELNGQIEAKKSKIDDLYIDQDLTICPTCYQEINEDVIMRIEARIGDIVEEITQVEGQISKINIELSELQKQKDVLLSDKTNVDEKRDEEFRESQKEIDEKYVAIQERLTAALGKLDEILKYERKKCEKDNIEERTNLEKKISEIEQLKSSLLLSISHRDKLFEEVYQLKVDVATNKEAIENKKKEEYNDSTLISIQIKEKGLRIEVKELQSTRGEFNELVEMTKFWREGFSASGIQSMLIDEAIPFMNSKISDYMDKLSNGRYSVSFDTMKATKAGEFRDKISVDVFDNNTHADARVKLSGGQERIVDIGTILTLCDLQSMIQDVEFNLLLFDEIFDALDDENIGYVANLIKQVSKDKWVGVISHRHLDSLECDDVLSFR